MSYPDRFKCFGSVTWLGRQLRGMLTSLMRDNILFLLVVILGATGRYAHLCHGGCKASGPNYNPYLATQSGDDNGLNQRSQGVSGTT